MNQERKQEQPGDCYIGDPLGGEPVERYHQRVQQCLTQGEDPGAEISTRAITFRSRLAAAAAVRSRCAGRPESRGTPGSRPR